MQADLLALGKVLASRHRVRMMNLLSGRMMTPSEISKSMGISLPYSTKLIRQLEALRMIECATPELRKGKLYRLTDKGNETLQSLRNISGKTNGKNNHRAR